MKYIYRSLEFSQQNLGLLTLFIIVNLIPILSNTFRQTENNVNIIYKLLLIIAYVSCLLILPGTYSITWKKFKNEPINFSLLISESKKNFCNLIGVTIVIAILGLIIAVVFDFIYKHIFDKNVESAGFHTTSEFGTIASISFYLVLLIYCYAVPYLYVKRLNSKRAFLKAPKIFIKYKSESAPILVLLLINLLIILYVPYDSIESWQITVSVYVILSYINFYIFLVSCQILDELDISNI